MINFVLGPLLEKYAFVGLGDSITTRLDINGMI